MRGVRAVFVVYLTVIVTGLAIAVALGLAGR
jgi:hypothetical protein